MSTKAVQSLTIVILGLFASGKTEFIKSLREIEVVSRLPNPIRPTTHKENQTALAVEFGRIIINDEFALSLFELPHQSGFNLAWNLLVKAGNLGVILLVDSTKPEKFREVRALIKALQSYDSLPFIVVASKSDEADAWPVVDLRAALQLDENIKLVPCHADPWGAPAKIVLWELLDGV